MDKEKEEKEKEKNQVGDGKTEVADMVGEARLEPEADVATDAGQQSEEAKQDTAKLIEEAENRGYLRGRNERIEELMSEPGMYCQLGVDEHAGAGLPPTEILQNMRRSVWD